MEVNKKAYEAYVKEVTPVNKKLPNIIKAFLVGGIICTIGQICTTLIMNQGVEKDTASAWTTLILIAASVILTGLNIYPKITKFGGAGALVPITGFANSVVAPAVEFKAEGQVFGIGCKIFTIAGPVILYGILSSWILGVIAYVLKAFGIV
ncbi:stage V sporulation protein AC [Lacrimispora xylanisolvens]|jgi:stage V sporulation protein AC|uniref:Stage V sporulation protein AC n=1 Tax=Lacrimispora xylanisolvens TaxID=384636 RepID=A0A2S6HMG8_9FIRM|nr:SpoVA/SpoVAEb family sporulation membrane protein [Hungatella xylanolytica]MBE5985903.1 SpoVA/SpoVAEb family sporulation membrane protein [Paenibacillaceae bacterium]MBE5986893.1 SpoVA/SpoVAEb family sporulation membrane protein [Paenibacillaceae bacterium]PPK78627.1 stage V sporulation protein AC [Hungatella xylanolytica]